MHGLGLKILDVTNEVVAEEKVLARGLASHARSFLVSLSNVVQQKKQDCDRSDKIKKAIASHFTMTTHSSAAY